MQTHLRVHNVNEGYVDFNEDGTSYVCISEDKQITVYDIAYSGYRDTIHGEFANGYWTWVEYIYIPDKEEPF